MANHLANHLITGLGLATNLGGVNVAAAAQRAGLSRRAQLPDYTVFELGPEMEAPVTAAPITGLTDGFMQPGLWLRLALACLDDLLVEGALPRAQDASFWRRTGLTWVLPELTPARFHWDGADILSVLNRTCGEPLLGLTGLPIEPAALRFLPGGSAAGAAAIRGAAEALDQGTIDRALILATDSWLDPLSMRALIGEDRIKSDEQPVGFCPGEAGAALLLESQRGAAARGARAQGKVLAVATRPAPAPPAAGDDADAEQSRAALAAEAGSRLASAVREALTSARAALPFPVPFVGSIVVDTNGEEWRALAWGCAQPPLLDLIDLDRCTIVMPAIQFGDVGATSGVLGVCLAARSFERAYWNPEGSLICSLSEGGAAAALILARPAST